MAQLANQCINLLLLANDDLVELIQQVLAKAGLDFQIGQSLVVVLLMLHRFRSRNLVLSQSIK